MQFWFLSQEDPLEKEMATHSCILAWRIPWTEKLDGLQFMGSQRVRHNWALTHSSFTVTPKLFGCLTLSWWMKESCKIPPPLTPLNCPCVTLLLTLALFTALFFTAYVLPSPSFHFPFSGTIWILFPDIRSILIYLSVRILLIKCSYFVSRRVSKQWGTKQAQTQQIPTRSFWNLPLDCLLCLGSDQSI